MRISNKSFKDAVKKNPDLQGEEFLEQVKVAFKDFGEWLDKKADDEGIASYTLILYKDMYNPGNRSVQINIRQCMPEDIVDSVIQSMSHLIYEIAKEDQHKLYVLHKLKEAVGVLEKKVLKKIGTDGFFKD